MPRKNTSERYRERLAQIFDSTEWNYDQPQAGADDYEHLLWLQENEPALGHEDQQQALLDLLQRHGNRSFHAAMSDEEYNAHVANAIRMVDEAVKAGKTTDQMHAGPMLGYSPERYAQQKEIEDHLYNKWFSGVPQNRQGLLMAGGSGSGKSTLMKQMKMPDGTPVVGNYGVIDPDEVKVELLNRGMYEPIPGLSPLEHAGLVHQESSDIAGRIARRAYQGGHNIVHDGTLTNLDSGRKKVKEMRENGYGVQGAFADIPFEVSAQRALNRHRKGLEAFRAGTPGSLGGRLVPPSYIAQQKSTDPKYSTVNRQNFDLLSQEGAFDAPGQVWDTSHPQPKRLAQRLAQLFLAEYDQLECGCSGGGEGDNSMNSYQSVCQSFAQGQIDFDGLLQAVSALPPPVRKPPVQSAAEAYARADEIDDDPNSLVWTYELFSAGLIDADQLILLVNTALGQ